MMISLSRNKILRQDAHHILSRLFNGERICWSFEPLFLNLVNKYVKGHLTRSQYVREICNLKGKYDRYLEVYDYFFSQVCLKENILPTPENKKKMVSQINQTFQDPINKYINNPSMKMKEISDNYQKVLKMERRQKIVNKLMKAMSRHPDFDCLPADILTYFGRYFNYYLVDEEFTLPFMLHKIEEKHNLILECVNPKTRDKIRYQKKSRI